jgi:putative sigma-54 modulation protein
MTLKVDIYPKNIELTEHIADYVNKKASKLDRYLSDIDEARVDLEFQKSMRNPADRQVAQVTLRGRGFILRSEERSDDLLTAIDTAIDHIQRKIERHKGKHARGRGDGTCQRSRGA